MDAVELLKALHASGTGLRKIEAARVAARNAGRVLARMSAQDLLMMMARAWPEGTVAKAFRLTQGLPADPPEAIGTSGPSDWEAWAREDKPDLEYEKAFRDRPLDVPEDEPGPRVVPVSMPDDGDARPPGIHGQPDEPRLHDPGVARRGPGRPRKVAQAAQTE